jgi:hypothetical protein
VYHYHSVIAPFRTGEEDGIQFSAEEERQFALAVLRLLIADARAAVANRTFGTHPSHLELRVPSQLDQRGLEETSAILVRALDEVMVVRRDSAERLRASEEEGTETISALLLFEAQPWKGPE